MENERKSLEKLITSLGICTGSFIEASIEPLKSLIKLLIIVFTFITFLIIVIFSILTYNIYNTNSKYCNNEIKVTHDDISTYTYRYSRIKGKEICRYYYKVENNKNIYKTICSRY